METEQVQHYTKLRLAYLRRLRVLELKQAYSGISTPAEIIIEIDDIREKIEEIDKKISLFKTEQGESTTPLVKSEKTKANIEIVLRGDFSTFTPDAQAEAIKAIAALLQIPPEEVKLLKVIPGSVVLKLNMPEDAAQMLIELHKAGTPIVLDVNSLGMEVSNVTTNSALSLEPTFEKPVQVFLCHAKEDESSVKLLYDSLLREGYKPWMAEEDILPGEQWRNSIKRAIKKSDFFMVCLSRNAVGRRGFLQKEIQEALKIWEEKLEDDIYLIPVRIEECIVPENLEGFQWVDLFNENGLSRLMRSINEGRKRLN